MEGVPGSSAIASYNASFAAPSSAVYAAAIATHPHLAGSYHKQNGSSMNGASRGSSTSVDNDCSTHNGDMLGAAGCDHSPSGTPNMSLILTIRLLMQGKEVGSIIGKRGEQIKLIREESGAKINISDGSCPERIVTITGSVTTINKAFEMVCNKFHEDLKALPNSVPKPPITMRMIIPATQCGSIIGKGGSKIKEIREATGASIQVASEMLPSSTERAVTLSGTAEAIILCMTHVCQILIEAPPKGVTLSYKPKPTYNPLLIASTAAATAAQQLALQQQQAAYAALMHQPTSVASSLSSGAGVTAQQYEQLARAQAVAVLQQQVAAASQSQQQQAQQQHAHQQQAQQQQAAAAMAAASGGMLPAHQAAQVAAYHQHQQQALQAAFAAQQQQQTAAFYAGAGGLMIPATNAGYGITAEEKSALEFIQAAYGGGAVLHPAAYAAMQQSMLFGGAPMMKAGGGPLTAGHGSSAAAAASNASPQGSGGGATHGAPGKASVSTTSAAAVRYAPY